MNHEECRELARRLGYKGVEYQTKYSPNSNKEFEVGYVSQDGKRVLFCKRGTGSSSDGFYLCNEFRGMEAVEKEPEVKRQGYRYGVEWIAMNDEPTDMDPESVAGFISVCLLADLFSKTTADVACDVVKFRMKEEAKNA